MAGQPHNFHIDCRFWQGKIRVFTLGTNSYAETSMKVSADVAYRISLRIIHRLLKWGIDINYNEPPPYKSLRGDLLAVDQASKSRR